MSSFHFFFLKIFYIFQNRNKIFSKKQNKILFFYSIFKNTTNFLVLLTNNNKTKKNTREKQKCREKMHTRKIRKQKWWNSWWKKHRISFFIYYSPLMLEFHVPNHERYSIRLLHHVFRPFLLNNNKRNNQFVNQSIFENSLPLKNLIISVKSILFSNIISR